MGAGRPSRIHSGSKSHIFEVEESNFQAPGASKGKNSERAENTLKLKHTEPRLWAGLQQLCFLQLCLHQGLLPMGHTEQQVPWPQLVLLYRWWNCLALAASTMAQNLLGGT